MNSYFNFERLDPLKLLSVTILLSILRTVVPYANYIFIPFFIVFSAYTLFVFLNSLKTDFLKRFLKFGFPILAIAVFVISGTLISGYFSMPALKEILYTSIIVVFCFSLFLFIRTPGDYIRFTSVFMIQIMWTAVFVSVLGLVKFILQIRGIDLHILQTSQMIAGTSLIDDYNFYCLFSVIGLIALYFSRAGINSKLLSAISILLILNIVFSGSRRGIVFIFFMGLAFFFLGPDFRIEFKRIARRLVVLCIIGILSVIALLFIRDQIRFAENNMSSDLGTTNTRKFKKVSAQILYRYLTVLNYDESFSQFYNRLWLFESAFDSTMKYGRYQSRNYEGNLLYNADFRHGLIFWEPNGTSTMHSVVKTPWGKGVKVTRFDGDGTGWSLEYAGRDIVFYPRHEYRLNFKFRVIKGDGVPFNSGFWVNDSYMGYGSAVNLKLELSDLQDGWKQASCSYFFRNVQFDVPFFVNSLGDSSIVEFSDIELYCLDNDDDKPRFADEISTDFKIVSSILSELYPEDNKPGSVDHAAGNLFLNGDFKLGTEYWIFNSDSTRHELINTAFGQGIRIRRGNGDGGGFSLLYSGRQYICYSGHEYTIRFKCRIIEGDGIPFDVGWWVNDNAKGYAAHSLNLKVSDLGAGWKQYEASCRFAGTHIAPPAFLNSLKDFSVVDITDVSLTDNDRNELLPVFYDQVANNDNLIIVSDSAQIDGVLNRNLFYGPRSDRWRYALVLFSDSLGIKDKFTGIGFRYMEMFGSKFGEVRYDYPHNPFLSSFLYSGFPGGLAYICFMLLVIVKFIRKLKFQLFYFLVFFSAFYFSFFSVNTHFTLPVFAILSVIPFLTDSVYETVRIEQKNEHLPAI